MENFKPSVPAEVQAKIKNVAEIILASAENSVMAEFHIEYYGDWRIEEIQGNHKPGWIAYQDGGFSVSGLVCSGWGSGNYITQDQEDNILAQEKYCIEAFISDYDLEIEYSDFDADNLPQELQEKFGDYEREYLDDPALLQWQVYVKGEKISLCASLNYRDSPYYRLKYAEYIIDREIDLAVFMAMADEDVVRMLILPA